MQGRSIWTWLTLGAGVLAALIIIFVRYYIDEPLRQTVERNVNQSLKGYTARIGALKFHPFSLSLELVDSTISQDAHPDPPVAHLPKLHAGVHWRALLNGRLVGDFLIDRPKLYINLRQAKQEVEDKASLAERGWQDALQEIYPLKVNVFQIRDAEITYVDEGPFKPLQLSGVNFRARNIRNVQSKTNVYPSDVYLEGVVFDSGKVVVDGQADFFAKPHAGIKAAFSLKQVELDYFKPIIRRYHFLVRDGVLSSDGRFEYASGAKIADLKHVTVQGVQIDYVHQARTAMEEKQMGQKVVRTAKELSNNPEVLLRVDQVNLQKSRLAFINKAAQPEYQMYFSDADLRLDNVSNRGAEGAAVGTLRGRFMGSGATVVNVAFQPKTKSSDFDLKIRVDGTDMTAMNDLLRAYGNFDVTQGRFSLYSELAVRDGAINGYVKPLFKDVKVYDARQDESKPFLRKVREGFVGAVAWVLSNRPRNEVGTTVNLSGRIDGPEFSNWEAFLGMLKNAFIEALTPGFEKKIQPTDAPGKKAQQQWSSMSS